MRTRVCALGGAGMIVAIVVTVPCVRVAGFSYFGVGVTPIAWPDAEATRFLSPTTFPAGSDPDTLILAAMRQWSSVPATEFQYFFARPPQDYPIDPFDGFSDTIAVVPEALDPGVLAITYMVNDGTNWYDMDTLISSLPGGIGWNFDANPDCELLTTPAPSNGFSLLPVLLHELGHGIGLGHNPVGDEPAGTPWLVATMNPHYPMGGTTGQENIVELHVDDRNGARFLYPHSGPSNPVHVDLASGAYAGTGGAFIGAAEPLFVDPSIVAPGGSFTARSVIENLGTSNVFTIHQGFYLSLDTSIDTSDMLIGELDWDLAFGDGFEFDVILQLPGDLLAGPYVLGSYLDDLDAINEVFEDNNAVAYCEPLVVSQLVPVIDPLGQQTIVAGSPYTGPVPSVTHPLNMGPLAWSLADAPAGMTIDAGTGVVSWADPVPGTFLYTILLRADNPAGSATALLFLGVLDEPDACAADCGPGGGDGVVDIVDFLSVLAEWGSGGPFDCDIDGDGVVGIGDFLQVLADWGGCVVPASDSD
jgi:hypothetical protein